MKVSKDNMWADNRRILPRRTTGVNKRLLKAIEESGMSNGQIAAAAETTISLVSAYLHNKMPFLGRDGWAPAFQRICTVLAVCPDEIAGMNVGRKMVDVGETTHLELHDNAFVNVLSIIGSLAKNRRVPSVKTRMLNFVRLFLIDGYTIREIARENHITPEYASFYIRKAIREIGEWFDKYGVTRKDFCDGTAEIKIRDALMNEKKLRNSPKNTTPFYTFRDYVIDDVKSKMGKDWEANKRLELKKYRDGRFYYCFPCTKENFRFYGRKHFVVVTDGGNIIKKGRIACPSVKTLKKCVVYAYKLNDGTLSCSSIQKAS